MSKSTASNTKNSRNSRKYNPITPSSTMLPDYFLNNLLNDENTTIELLTAGSLKGFVFKIRNQNISYIMKVVVLSHKRKYLLSNCMNMIKSLKEKNKEKHTEKVENFIIESEVQNIINKETSRGGRTPICPEVKRAVIFNNEISENLLKLLTRRKIQNTNTYDETDDVIESLKYYFNIKMRSPLYFTQFELGILLMPEFEDSITLSMVDDADPNLNNAYNHIFSQIIYLFLIVKMINIDMHQGNALVKVNHLGLKTQLIDFGNVIILNDSLIQKISNYTRDNNISEQEYAYIHEIIQTLKTEFIDFIGKELTDNIKNNFIMKTMNIINLLCWAINHRTLSYTNPEGHQMDWFVPIPIAKQFMIDNNKVFKRKDTINDTNLGLILKSLSEFNYSNYQHQDAFDLLMNNYVTISVKNDKYTPLNVIRFESNRMPNNGSVDMNDDNNNQNQDCNEGIVSNKSTCNIMGGKKSTKKHTKKSFRKSHKKHTKKSTRKSKQRDL